MKEETIWRKKIS